MRLDLFKTNGSSPPATDAYAGCFSIPLIEPTTEASASSPLTRRQNRDSSAQAKSPARVRFTAVVDRPQTMNAVCLWSSFSRATCRRRSM